MSVTTPAYPIPRWSVVGMEGMFTKMWDPPTESPATPDAITPTNPVPEVMAAAGMALAPSAPHTMQLDLLHNLSLPTWDGLKTLNFFTFVNPDVAATVNGTYPSTTIRVPVGAIFHCATTGKGPPPHTIHWHGIEPTPMNDGVGHCSMEIGKYTYQWQPTFIGTYFYHCHRNTMMHFEYGLFGLMIFEPADAFFATLADPTIPIGYCRDGKRRTGANLAPTALNPTGFPQFPGWQGGLRTDPDPWTGNPALKLQNLNPTLGNIDPHAQTVPYDVEAIWVFDDRSSTWSDATSDAKTTFPSHGPHPGYDDDFYGTAGGTVSPTAFFAFNDFGADYWFVSGIPVPAHKGGTGTIPAGIVIPPELNSGISGSQISVEGYVGQTILIRALDAAYNNCTYTFPVDVVILEWDGRPLGVPPYGFNEAYLVPAGTQIEVSVGRRFGALIRVFSPLNDFAVGKFIDTRGATIPGSEQVLCTVKVPINISPLTVAATSDKASPQPPGTVITFTATMPGKPGSQAPTSGPFEYRFYLNDGSGAGFVLKQDYSAQNTWQWTSVAAGTFDVFVEIRAAGSPNLRDAYTSIIGYTVLSTPATGLTLTTDKSSPESLGNTITFTANQQGGLGTFEYRFYLNDGSGSGFILKQDYSPANTWLWTPAATGNYDVFAEARLQGSGVLRDASAVINFYQIIGVVLAKNVTLTADGANSQLAGSAQTFHALASGGSGTYEYRFYVNDGSGAGYLLQGPYSSATADFIWTPVVAGNYDIFVEARTVGSPQFRDAYGTVFFYRIN